MPKEIGLCIDHRKAVVVIVSDEGEEVKKITYNMEKHVRFSNDYSKGGSSEDVHDRQLGNRLNSFYDKVVALSRDIDLVQILALGEAKCEFKKNASRVEASRGNNGG